MTALATVFVEGRIDTSRFGTDIKTGMATSQVSSSMAAGGTTASKSFGSRFASGLGTAAKVGGIALGAAAVYGAASFAKNAVSLEASFSKTMNVMKATTGASGTELKGLSDLAIKMGQDTVFSANDAADAMLELAKSGISPATIQAGALKEALTLAAAGGVGMEEAATVMGNALNTFNLKGTESASVAAALAGAANASTASIGSIADGLQQFGTVAADSDQTVQGATAAIAAMANAGIAGSDAGTSLKTMFARLIPSTKTAQVAFEAYGLSNFEAKGAMDDLAKLGIEPLTNKFGDVRQAIAEYVTAQTGMKEGTDDHNQAVDKLLYSTGLMQNAFVKQDGSFKGMTQIAGVLDDRFGDLSSSERAAAFNTLFGSDARRAATVMTKEGAEGLAKYIRATSDSTAADKAAAAQMKGTAGAIEQRKGSIETLGLAFGLAIAPLVEFGNLMVAKIANKAVPIVEDLGVKLKELIANGPSFGELGARIGATFGKISDAFSALFRGGDARNDVNAFGEIMDNVFGNTGKYAGFFETVGSGILQIRDAFASINWSDVKAGFSGVGDAARGINWDSIRAGFVGIWDAVKGADWAGIKTAFVDIGNALKNVDWSRFTGALGQGTADTVSVFSVVIKFLAGHIDTLAKYMPLLIGAFIAYKAAQTASNVAAIASLPLQVAKIGSNILLSGSQRALATQMAITNGVEKTGMITRARTTVVTIAKTLAEKAAAVASKAMAAATWLVNAAMRANPIGILVTALVALGAGLVLAYKKSETFRNIVNGAWDAIKKGASAAWGGIKGVLQSFGDFLTGTLFPAIRSLWDKVVKPVFKAVGDAISFWWNNMAKPVFSAWKTYFTDVLFPTIRFLWDKVVKPVFRGIGDAISFWWNNMAKPVFAALKSYFTDVLFPVIRFLWDKVVKPVFTGIKGTISDAWTAIKTVTSKAWDGIKTLLGNVWGWVKSALGNYVDLWKSILSKGWDLIKTGVGNAWGGIKTLLSNVWGWVKTALGNYVGAWKNILSNAWDAIKTGVGNTWDWVKTKISGVWDGIKSVLGNVGEWLRNNVLGAFQNVVGAIGTAWAKLEGLAAKPINFILGTVYNNGLREAFNWIMSKLGSSFRLDPVSLISTSSGSSAGYSGSGRMMGRDTLGLARGGVVPGADMGYDTVPARLRGRESVMVPAFTDLVGGAKGVHALNRAAERGGNLDPKKWTGVGGLGDVWGWVKDNILEETVDWVEGKFQDAISSATSALGDSPWAKLATAMPTKVASGAMDYVKDKLGLSSNEPLTISSPGMLGPVLPGGWTKPITSYAITAGFPSYPSGGYHSGIDLAGPTGTPVWAAHAGKVSQSADYPGYEPRQPDGGNGFRSYGRFVEIAHGGGLSTFAAHLNDRAVRTGQMVKAGDLIGHRGDKGNSSGSHLHWEGRINGVPVNPQGFNGIRFDQGGWLKDIAVNMGGKPEAVLSPRQSEAFVRLARAAEASTGTAMPKRLQLVVGDKVFDAYVRDVADSRVDAHADFAASRGRAR